MGGRSGQSISGQGAGAVDSLATKTASDAKAIHKGDVKGYEDYVYNDVEGINNRSAKLKTTEELKKEVGRYISTENVYKRPTVEMPQAVKYRLQGLGKTKVDALINKSETKSIKISDINITQQHVFEKPLLKAMSVKKYKVVVFEYKGKYYLNDGNHRVAAAHLNKKKNIKVAIEKVD